MQRDMKIAYAEIYEILRNMPKKEVMKIPIGLLEKIKTEKQENYVTRIDKNDIFNKNNITRQTLALLAYINLNYWAEKEEADKLKKLYEINERKKQEEMRRLYNPDKIFEKQKCTKAEINNPVTKIETE